MSRPQPRHHEHERVAGAIDGGDPDMTPDGGAGHHHRVAYRILERDESVLSQGGHQEVDGVQTADHQRFSEDADEAGHGA